MEEAMSEVKDNFIGTLAEILEAMLNLQQHNTPLTHELKVALRDLISFNDKVDRLNICYSADLWRNLKEVSRGSESSYHVQFAIEECITFRECLDMSISFLYGIESLQSISSRSDEEEEIAS